MSFVRVVSAPVSAPQQTSSAVAMHPMRRAASDGGSGAQRPGGGGCVFAADFARSSIIALHARTHYGNSKSYFRVCFFVRRRDDWRATLSSDVRAAAEGRLRAALATECGGDLVALLDISARVCEELVRATAPSRLDYVRQSIIVPGVLKKRRAEGHVAVPAADTASGGTEAATAAAAAAVEHIASAAVASDDDGAGEERRSKVARVQ